MFGIILRVALREIKSAWTRSLLTMLGVVIGVAAVVSMVSMGEGAKRDIISNINKLGANLLIVRPGLLQQRHVRNVSAQTLTVDDAELIRKEIPHVVAVSPVSLRTAQVKYLNKNASTTLSGVSPGYLEVRSFSVDRGRFFSGREMASARRVAAIGYDVAKELFGSRRAVGEYIRIKGVNFLVMAVMAKKGDMGWFNADDQVLIPLTTYQKRLFGISYVRDISIKVDSKERMDEVKAGIEKLLRKSHRLPPDKENDFHVRSQTDIIESMEQITRTFTFLLGGVAAISLLVGGIGIMNIMLVTVTERTREIGLRKALGAKKRDILWQFVVEALVLSGLGGIIGLLMGYGGAYGIEALTEWSAHVSANSAVLAYSVALGTGLFFGWYPALKAARLNPAEALRRL